MRWYSFTVASGSTYSFYLDRVYISGIMQYDCTYNSSEYASFALTFVYAKRMVLVEMALAALCFYCFHKLKNLLRVLDHPNEVQARVVIEMTKVC